MAISNNQELYNAIQSLVDELNQMGEGRWSSALEDALSTSTVPGEILGETRLQLQTLRASQTSTRLGLDQSIDEALSYLNKILGQ